MMAAKCPSYKRDASNSGQMYTFNVSNFLSNKKGAPLKEALAYGN